MRKNSHDKILKGELKEQHLSTVLKSFPLSYHLNSKSIWNYSNRKEEYLYYKVLSDWLYFLKKKKSGGLNWKVNL